MPASKRVTMLLFYHHLAGQNLTRSRILVFIQHCNKPCILRQPATHSIRKWSTEAIMLLRSCFECTKWNVQLESQGNNMDTDRMVDCTTAYIKFCRDIVILARTMCYFPSNTPQITCDIKALLNQTADAFSDGERD